MKLKYFIFSLFLFLTLACKSTLIADLVTQPGDILFKDDFSQMSGGWPRSTVDEEYDLPDGSIVDYADGAYQIYVNSAEYDYWANPNLSFTDVRVEVDATLVRGSEINRMGLLCRYKDEKNFYFFIISSDGYYAIGKVVDDELSLLGDDQMLRTRVLKRDGNHLRADCVGPTLTFYANDQPLGIIEDFDLAAGDVGLIAGAFNEAGVDVRFDNFVVYKP